MFSVAANNGLLSDLEKPGHGKRSMPPPPPPTYKKQLKNLNLSSKNPLLSGNSRMDTEDPFSLLEASENDIQPQEEKEFDIPPGMEAFAEKIGLEWDLNETPSQKVVKSPSSAPLFQVYAQPQTGPEEELWGDLSLVSVSPMEVEGRQFTESAVETEQTVTTDVTTDVTKGVTKNENNNYQGKMNPVLTEEETENFHVNENIPQFTEADYMDLDVFLETGLASEPIVENVGQKFDIVKFAIGESGLGLDEDEDLTEYESAKTDNDEDYVPDFKKIKEEPAEIIEMKPVENVSIEVIEDTPRQRKRRVGRPNNTDPITVTVIPEACKLSVNELAALKYQRTRELNNKASRRFRVRKKALEEQCQQELEQLRARNYQLQETADAMEREVALLKAKVSNINQ